MSALKNNRWLSVATLVLLVANIVTLALLWNQRSNHDNDKRNQPGPVFEFLTTALQLNEKQQADYRQLRDEHQANQRRFQDSIRKAKDALFALLKQPAVPDSLLQEYSKRATAFDQQLDIITFRHFQQVRALCDPVQQKKFDDIIKDVMHRMARPGRRPPPPGAGNHPPPGAENEEPGPPQH